MRVLTVGTLNGRLTAASKFAADKGATVIHTADIAEALAALREGGNANLILVDIAISIPELVRRLESAHTQTPIIACGTAADAGGAADAIRDGAKGYISLATDLEPIAAVLAAAAADTRAPIEREDATSGVIKLAQQTATSEVAVTPLPAQQACGALVGHTVAEVERDLILETLKHCLGNRTHAANLLGISIRTLRNKLNEYTAAGLVVPPPGGSVSSESRKAA
jgi:DNA-binding NtrC family response regulator